MSGLVPLNNSFFANTPADFNHHVFSGASGGTLRTFDFVDATATGLPASLTSGSVWKFFYTTGNQKTHLPIGLSAAVGDEIVFYSANGTISVTSDYVNNIYEIINQNPSSGTAENVKVATYLRPLRLIKYEPDSTASPYGRWFVAHSGAYYKSLMVRDCCNNDYTLYQLRTGDRNVLDTAVDATAAVYNDKYGLGFFPPGLGGTGVSSVYTDPTTGVVYTVSSGILTLITECASSPAFVSYAGSNNFYNAYGIGITLYTTLENVISNLYNAVNYKFKTEPWAGYDCASTYNANGTYYAGYDPYGPNNPVCIQNGWITSFTACV